VSGLNQRFTKPPILTDPRVRISLSPPMTKYRFILILLFIAVWIWAAINPVYPHDWLLENYLVFIFVPIILILGRYFKLSNVSYTLITIFMILHVVGSHYTYAEVPFGFTLQNWLGADRNMYDRLVHFSFGLLLAYPIREMFMRISKAKGFWSYYLPIDLAGASSAIYEIIEWLTARNVDPAAGLAFLGSQGDIWDAQKDMTLAILGSIIAMIIVFLINWKFNKNHWKEIKDSFKLGKDDKPLGEEKLKEYLTK
jgi:putative membrane protein